MRSKDGLRHLVNTLADLEALGLAFISLRDNLDFTTPSGKLQFHVLAAVAEFERSLISERVRAGMRAATKRGKRSGRPRTRVEPARVRELRASGVSWTKIANASRQCNKICARKIRLLNLARITNYGGPGVKKRLCYVAS